MDAIEKAAQVVGSKSKLARQLGISPQAVSKWKEIPAERVIEIESLTNKQVLRHEMRPDIYPPEDYQPKQ